MKKTAIVMQSVLLATIALAAGCTSDQSGPNASATPSSSSSTGGSRGFSYRSGYYPRYVGFRSHRVRYGGGSSISATTDSSGGGFWGGARRGFASFGRGLG